MRVIAGSARRLELRTPKGMDTRPTTDRIKETLFNMLAPRIPGCAFLDLFAGSGGIGIEALSRGAKEAVFVERSPAAFACIRENLAHTRLSDRAQVLKMDVFQALAQLSGRGAAFDCVFMDPPYDRLIERKVLETLSGSRLLKEDGLIVAEASIRTDFGYVEELGFEIVKNKEYKTNKHVFITWSGSE